MNRLHVLQQDTSFDWQLADLTLGEYGPLLFAFSHIDRHGILLASSLKEKLENVIRVLESVGGQQSSRVWSRTVGFRIDLRRRILLTTVRCQ